jgi:hypothetical protein
VILVKLIYFLEVNPVLSSFYSEFTISEMKCSRRKSSVFRYSYANVAKQLGYSKDLIAEALGHEYGNSVTGIYLEQFDNDIVDKMNLNIINSVVKSL